MKILNETLIISSSKELEFMNITDRIIKIFEKSKIEHGILNLFSKHTTLAIKINEDEALLRKDFDWFMKTLAPENKQYEHDKIEKRLNCLPDEPKNSKGHLRTLVLETSQFIPINNYKLQLGRFQQIFAIETSGPREREIIIQILGE